MLDVMYLVFVVLKEMYDEHKEFNNKQAHRDLPRYYQRVQDRLELIQEAQRDKPEEERMFDLQYMKSMVSLVSYHVKRLEAMKGVK